MSKREQIGFTLIEMSIVLVIIGLLTGAVLFGRELVTQAKLKATLGDVQYFQTAAAGFRDKYGGLPGDLINAYLFWGAACGANGANGTNTYLPSNGNACNGNGNGLIEGYNASWGEDKKAWQHLTLAGMIPGNYTGLSVGGYRVPGVVVPPGRIGTTVYEFVGVPSGGITDIYGNTGQYIEMSGYNPTLNAAGSNVGFMAAKEAAEFSQKYGSGSPTSGSILVGRGVVGGIEEVGCVSGWYVGGSPSTTFNLTDTNQYCVLFFPLRL